MVSTVWKELIHHLTALGVRRPPTGDSDSTHDPSYVPENWWENPGEKKASPRPPVIGVATPAPVPALTRLSRKQFLSSPTAALFGYWLRIKCADCRAESFPLCDVVAQQVGGNACLRDALGVYRCTHCGGCAAHVVATNVPAGTVSDVQAWIVELVP
jgi:hypothetical protein